MAPEVPGAVELIRWLAGHGVAISLGHSNASVEEARIAYAAGATSTTHLFNAMIGIDHRAPGWLRWRCLRTRSGWSSSPTVSTSIPPCGR
jgi:N-acetylglucosamine-6-phosphate deacetylase